jgi:Tol biopolymer transport system component
VYVSKADGTSARRIVRGFSPTWSPDGSRLAYGDLGNPSGDPYQIEVIDLKSRRTQLVATYAEYPSWSPRGDQIAYIDDLGEHRSLSVVRPDGTGHRVIWSDRGVSTPLDPEWSPSGNRIAFFRDRNDIERSDLVVMNVGSPHLRRLARRGGFYWYYHGGIAWSPSGHRIAYSTSPPNRDERPDLYIVPSAGGARKLVLHNASYPAWRPRL